MKNFKIENTLKSKITLNIVIYSFFAILIICTTITYYLRKNALEIAQKLALNEAKEYASSILSELDKALITNRSISNNLKTIKTNNLTASDGIAREHIERKPHFYRDLYRLGTQCI
jgi:hypothetical protein